MIRALNHFSILDLLRQTMQDHRRIRQLVADVRKERQTLATLSERDLKDIGLTRVDALFEANRAANDIPEWRKPAERLESVTRSPFTIV